KALTLAAKMITEIAGGAIVWKGIYEATTFQISKKRLIRLRPSRVKKILGISLHPEEIQNYIHRLQISCLIKEEDLLEVEITTFRKDLEKEIDLIEEVARLYGYENIPSRISQTSGKRLKKNKKREIIERAKDLLISHGFFEVINYSFISSQSQELFVYPQEINPDCWIKLQNPLNESQSIMRISLIPSLLMVMRENLKTKLPYLRIFEVGKVYRYHKDHKTPLEKERIAALITGPRHRSGLPEGKGEVNFYDAKGYIENIFEYLRIKGYNFRASKEIPYLHPGKSAQILLDGREIGTVGEIHPIIQESFELKKSCLVFEMDMEALITSETPSIQIESVSLFPPIFRDIAIIVDGATTFQGIMQAIDRYKNGYLEEVELFDVYQGPPIPPGMKSLAFRLRYQAKERTLVDEEVNHLHNELDSQVLKEMGGKLRE
ncbi:MAG: phenylalanine--tRNA ligase subunit beta, partial [bacterium]|nr:phenylalanine--tRNA ligase subunit beta [bacterium]